MTEEAVVAPTPRVKKFKRGPIVVLKQTENGLQEFASSGMTDINEAIAWAKNEAINRREVGKFQFRCDYLRADDQPIVLEIAQQTEFAATV